MRTHTLCLFALLVPGLATAGLKDALGIKKNLKKLSVESIELDPAGPILACPGGTREDAFDVVAVVAGGERLSTADKITWRSYDLSVSAGAIGNKGQIELPGDPLATWGQPVTLNVVASDHPDKTTTGVIHPSYDCGFRGNFQGVRGDMGPPGAAGSTGSSGGDGQNGGDAGGGADGRDGQILEVFVALGEDPLQHEKVLMVKVHSKTTGQDVFFAVDADQGSLVIDASGGGGGTGGTGGPGGSGGYGQTNGPGGDGGDGGNGGDGGDGGDGGTITMTVDPAAKPFVDRITLRNAGGEGGHPGGGGTAGTGGTGSGGAPNGANGTQGQPSVSYGQPGAPGPEPTIRYAAVRKPW